MTKILSAITVLAGLATSAQSADTQKFKLITNPLVMPPGKDAFTFIVTVLATGLPVDPKKPLKPSLVDAQTPAFPPVQVTAQYRSSNDPKSAHQTLTFKVKVANFPPADNESRTFTASYGDVHEPLPYTLTNIPARTFSWSVKAPSEWNLSSTSMLPISVVIEKDSRKAVGLLHAADDLGTFYYAHPIAHVLKELEIELKLS